MKEKKGKISLGVILTASVLFSIGLVAARIWWTDSLRYASLIWNLFLAWIPYGIALGVVHRRSWFRHPLVFYFTVAFWLIFFPNAPYLITDLFHLNQQPEVPLWYDLTLIFSFAWNGLVLGFVSLMHMEQEVQRRHGQRLGLLFSAVVLALGAYGVFLGRYLRWNSWDLLVNPFSLLAHMAQMIRHPLHFPGVWGMTLLLSTLSGLIYLTLKSLGRKRLPG
jgi:uncharacterized membrane protein